MAKYVNESVAQAIANDIQKNRVLLGAFDTVDTSNANYNLITRNTVILYADKIEWEYASFSGRYYKQLSGIVIPPDDNTLGQLVSSNYAIRTANQTASENETIGIDSLGEVLIKSSSVPKGVIQIKSSTSYTEKVIKGVPILNLDQNGANWLRSEWEKGLNLVNTDDIVIGDINDSRQTRARITLGYFPAGFTFSYKVNSTYRCSITTMSTPFPTSNISILYNGIDDAQDIRVGTFTLTSDCYIGLVFANENINTDIDLSSLKSNIKVMLVEGDHAYPYQPYSGAIVHEKEIENIAKTNVNNQFSVAQTINAKGSSNDTALNLNTEYAYACDIKFLCQNNTVGFIGVNNKKPYWWGVSGGKADGVLLTENDIANVAYKNINNYFATDQTITGSLTVTSTSSNRATINLLSTGDSPNDLWFGSNNQGKWSISSRDSSSNYFIGLYNAGYDGWAWNTDFTTNITDFKVNPTVNGVRIATTNDIPTVNDGTLTIQKNGSTVATFTANQSGNSTANISVPTPLTTTAASSAGRWPGGSYSSDISHFVTPNDIYFWNGAVTGTTSYLAYCNQGAFGSIVTHSASDYLPISGGTLTGQLAVNASGVYPTKPSISWNKVGSYFGGIGCNNTSNENYFGAIDGNGAWVANTNNEKWKFDGTIIATKDVEAVSVKVAQKATMQYNSNEDCIDFIFN